MGEGSKEKRKTTDEQFKEWQDFLNLVVGALAFSLGMAALGTNSPSTNAFISILFLILFICYGPFPATLLMLRSKDNRTFTEELIRNGIVKRRLGPRALFQKHPVYLSGWLFLIFVALSNQAIKWSSLIKQYIEGRL